jgi:hypothetical protein
MAKTDRFPGWAFPVEGTTDWYDAQEQAKRAVPCPHCGALVPVEYGQYHVDFHNAPWKIGFTPRPAPAPYVPPAGNDPALGGGPVASTDPATQ